ncbi:MAG TPA: FAD-binding oxidoreductase [Blastococcus sp.]|nr:FAD-binding oxidoreductase [Blastococcus sp.]
MTLLTTIPGVRGRVLRRGEEGYENVRRGECWHDRVPTRYPELIVLATGEDDVVGAVQLARREGLQIAVRSGGHSWSGSHLRDGTVLIDLSNLREVEVDVAARTGSVQPGITGWELSSMLAPQGLFFPTGHSTGVGIGGYLLQGGFGWSGREYGPACLSVTAVDVVTASGELVRADETQHSDLFWAARGAGPGFFGVVTRFHLALYPRRDVTMISSYGFPVATIPDVLGFVHEMGRQTPAEIIAMITRNPANGGELEVQLHAKAYTDTEEEAREQLALFESCPARPQALWTMLEVPTDHVTLTRMADGGRFADSKRWMADNVGTRADFRDLWPTVQDLVETWPDSWESHVLIFNWDNDAQPPRPPMAFDLEGDLFYSVYAAWDDPAEDDEHIRWVTDHVRALEPTATGTMLADENLAHRPFRFMSDENLLRLDELRTRWDPDGLFVAWLGRPELTTQEG